ncbi:FtsQ-type POTRA domain-containing protein [Virgibacillus sp. MSJ-26]|uniref:cell division protein FtsQ/DivIB n=1 Tax=Virgibacillus sp. MSJ-26 TaxID=2841522 RepID=UPI001C10E4C2|nr:FtsQ-type POTRA domain-containing protein [Virgibacillus sp. MSJ-26]MBU5467734.1 FtsQ-type POTRA domain-containing protein [Virgibacillus sp. MSJ-26]
MSEKNVVSIEDRIPKLKQERKKKANRRLIFYLSIFFLLVSLVVYLQSPLSNVKTINVTGNNVLSKEEIIQLSELTKQTNIWAINKSNMTESIQKNAMVDTVSIKRSLPWTVNVTIKEFDLVGFIKDEEHYMPVIEDGEIITDRQTKSINGDAPLLLNFSEKDYLDKMAVELYELPKSISNLISEVYWDPTEENKNKILLYMNDGYVVSSTIRDFSEKMTVYPSIVSQLDPEDKGIIHIGGGAYFESFQSEDQKKEEE